MPRVELLKDWQGYKQGRTLTPPGGVVAELVKRGFAKLVKETRKGKAACLGN